MDKKYLYPIFLSFLNELNNEISERFPNLNEDERKLYSDFVLSRLLVAPLNARGSVSELLKTL